MSGIENAKKTMGWQALGNRPSCTNCAHVRNDDEQPSFPSLRCTAGGFFTQRFATCDHHLPVTLIGDTQK